MPGAEGGTPDRPAIMIVAGEASGDLHGAALARALTALAPRYRLTGMGGSEMRRAGVTLLAEPGAAAVVGFTEAVRGLPAAWGLWRRLRRAVRTGRPAALVLVDSPELNLRLAAVARRVGVPVVYFVPPQVWAWRAGRLRAIRERVSLVLATLPFEPALYRRAGIPVTFIGHPVLDAVAGAPTRETARAGLGLPDDAELVALLPGSRAAEVARMTPLLAAVAARLAAARPGLRFALPLASTVPAEWVRPHLAAGPPVQVIAGASHTVLRAADLALVTSGTATLEAALLGTPMVVCYRVSAVTERLVQLLVRVPWIGLVNLILGRRAVPELCRRRDATPERIAAESLGLLASPGARQVQLDAFRELAAELGAAGVGRRAASHILALLAGGPGRSAPEVAATPADPGPVAVP